METAGASSAWHSMSTFDSVRLLNSHPTGITEVEAARRLREAGANALPVAKPPGALSVVGKQLLSPLVLVLLVAAGVSAAITKDVVDSVVILLLVALNAAIGATQELQARRSLDALRRMLSPQAVVLRDSTPKSLPTERLVTGDVVLLAAGDRVPADLRLIEAHSLAIDESALTGESVPADKAIESVGTEALIGDRSCMAYSSTFVTRGRATGVVVATGPATEVGRIASELAQPEMDRPTPLQRQLMKLGRLAGIAVVAMVALLLAVGIAQGRDPTSMFLLAVSLAVAAIPEGLIAISAIMLAVGVRRMASRGTIVRNLDAVETIGSASVICVDKTGTITENRMRVQNSWLPPGETSHDRLIHVAVLCNDSLLGDNGAKDHGDPMELALLRWAQQAGVGKSEMEKSLPRVMEIPFDSARKVMSTIHRLSDGSILVQSKGGVDEVLALCTSTPRSIAEQAQVMNHRFSSEGSRVLAFATRSATSEETASWERDLEFLGLVAFEDPPRASVPNDILICREAGIIPVMITGDHATTAEAIARRIGLLGERIVIAGRELSAITDAELNDRIADIGVFARTSPDSKVRIVEAWHSHGVVVAMTGDGVNDGPALRAADVGCAMGYTGTDVARDAADIVITDDNFSTVVAAVEEGRRSHDNLAKATAFLLSTNIGEVVLLLTAIFVGLPAPLAPVHILIVNLVTDGAPALALVTDPPARDVMRRPPRKPGLLHKSDLIRIAYQGMVFGAASLAAFLLAGAIGQQELAQTMAFTTLALSQVMHSFSVRSPTESVFSRHATSNRTLAAAAIGSIVLIAALAYLPLNSVVELMPLPPLAAVLSAALALLTLLVVEASKAWTRLGLVTT